MTTEQRLLIEFIIQDIVCFIKEDKNVSMLEAMHIFYTSDFIDLLLNVETGLYINGSAYVYEYYKKAESKKTNFFS